MKINGINVTGIKTAVSDVKRECADRWAILLDISDWSVRERGLIGQDYIVTQYPTVRIATGNANGGWGHDYISMDKLKHIIKDIMDCRAKAKDEYKSGKRHWGYEDCDEESERLYIIAELQAHGLI
jgi:hypothetical protein